MVFLAVRGIPLRKLGGGPSDTVTPVRRGSIEEPVATATSPDAAVEPNRLSRRERRRRKPWLARALGLSERTASAIEWIALIAGTVIVALILRTFIVTAFWIPSASMQPTLALQDRILVNQLDRAPGRGDIVVFRSIPGTQADNAPKDLVKRVIGIPGDTIQAKDGIVYINGEPLDERYLPDAVFTEDFGPGLKAPDGNALVDPSGKAVATIPAGSYFMMGDNRGDSRDSREWGPVPGEQIIGSAFVRFWPINRLGLL